MEKQNFEEEPLTLKDFQSEEASPVLVIEPGFTKENVIFQIYIFLVNKFDKAFVGYPVFFLFPNESQNQAKVFLSASEVGARIADCMEVRPNHWVVVSIEKDGTMVHVSFEDATTRETDRRLLEMPVIGSC
jgi:hypothetical protein